MTDQLITSPHAEIILENLLFQGSRNDCGPFSAATVINALKSTNLDPIALAEEMNHPSWRGPLPLIRRIPNSATFPWGMVDVFNAYGLQASWRIMTSYEYILEALALGVIVLPIIGSWNPTWAHIMSLIQHHPEHGLGFANTQYPQHTYYYLPVNDFISKWRFALNCIVEVRNA